MTSNDAHVRTTALMGTVVRVEVIGHSAAAGARQQRDAAIGRAFDWFRAVEECCSRFDPASEISRLATCVGDEISVSAMLAGILRFALALAEETGGAFDPTLGHLMASRGDNIEYRSGMAVQTHARESGMGSWRDVDVDAARDLISIRKPVAFDLGALAKGLAVDLAARELGTLRNFAVDAGGDLYLGGTNAEGEPWRVGIRHPRSGADIMQVLRVSDAAVCTSGDYERRHREAGAGEHHILDSRTSRSATAAVSATVVAPSAMVADGLATAAFVLGPVDGVALLERHGVSGVIVDRDLEPHVTQTMRDYFDRVAE